jgi:large subunit ribosomal protein L3
MINALLGKKVGMTSVYNEAGELLPVTVIELGPCTVVQVKTAKTDGYTSLQLGFAERKPKNVTQPVAGHYKKASVTPKWFLREVGWDGKDADLKAGSVLKADVFAGQKKVDVIGTSKGKGFQGVVRRHGFKGGPVTHGQCDRLRAPGSIGQSSFPSRVLKGTRMAGRMGGIQHTMRNLKVVRVDAERNAILVEGPVAGPTGAYVIVRRAG